MNDEALDATPAGGNGRLMLRGALGGTLMGLANLVPGISGGTMLLAAGVYPGFISGIAEITTLRFRPRSILLLGSIVATAALALLLLAGTVKDLVVEHRWIMYSLFIGLTLGGVPLVWRMARPADRGVAIGAVAAFAVMVAMATSGGVAGGGDERNTVLLFAAGLAGASAMILPGVSGGYLLLLLGQYEPILETIDQLKEALLADGGPDVALIADAMVVIVPLGLGIVVGVVGVSNLLRWLLRRFPKPTLGALLGLLFGAVVGLWPFQQGEPPVPGDVIKGRVVTVETAPAVEPDDWPVVRFEPSSAQIPSSLALIGLGLGATMLIGRLGNDPG